MPWWCHLSSWIKLSLKPHGFRGANTLSLFILVHFGFLPVTAGRVPNNYTLKPKMLHYYLSFTQKRCGLDMKSKAVLSRYGVWNTTEAESLGEETMGLSSPSWVSFSENTFLLVYKCGKEVSRNQANPFPNVNTKIYIPLPKGSSFGVVSFWVNTFIVIDAICIAPLKSWIKEPGAAHVPSTKARGNSTFLFLFQWFQWTIEFVFINTQ